MEAGIYIMDQGSFLFLFEELTRLQKSWDQGKAADHLPNIHSLINSFRPSYLENHGQAVERHCKNRDQ